MDLFTMMTAAAIVTFLVTAVHALPEMMATVMTFSVVMTAFMLLAMMMSALMTFSVMMATVMPLTVMMAVVVAPGVRIIFQCAFSKCLCCSVCRFLNTCVKLDSGIRKRCLRSHADASADQGVRLHGLQEAREGAMAASVSINNLLINDLTLFNIIQFKLRGMAKVLKDLSVFVCDCNSHSICSFLDDFLIDLDRTAFTVSA